MEQIKMSIYKLTNDYDRYWTFNVNTQELGKKLGTKALRHFAGNSEIENWNEIEGIFIPGGGRPAKIVIPDLCIWLTGNIVMKSKPHEILANDLKKFGEFLPAKCEGIPYYIYNVLNIINDSYVDIENSIQSIHDGIYMGIDRLEFFNDKLNDQLIFKTNFDKCGATYCTDQFKTLIEEAGLTGLIFETDLAKY